MGRKAKRAKLAARIARLSGELNTTPEPTLAVENSQKIEELKTKNPEPAVEEPTVLEEPKFMTEAEPVKVVAEEPKVEVKKTTKKRAPRKTTATRAKKTTNTRRKTAKSISSEK